MSALARETGNSEISSLCGMLQKTLIHTDKDTLLDQKFTQAPLSFIFIEVLSLVLALAC